MQTIKILDEATINKIAAGEVIERPLSIVKELTENAIDAGSTAITIEIKGGGIDLVRVTDNGCGIPSSQIRQAFLPHATSKIETAEDLFTVRSLGFRGEALSSIAAVCQTEVITKTPEELTGIRFRIDGGKEISADEVGAPDGTTFIVRNLFYHTPARRKFLKSPATEAGYITEFVQQLAICYAQISFKYVVNNQTKLVTGGTGNRVENIYKIFGREISDQILSKEVSGAHMSAKIYAAKPVVARSSREYEIFFVNGHFIKDRILQKALEDAYQPFLMQHRFPFAVLILNLDPALADVNVHPRKTEMKFMESEALYAFVKESVSELLSETEHLNDALPEPVGTEEVRVPEDNPEPFEINRRRKEQERYALLPAEDEVFEITEESFRELQVSENADYTAAPVLKEEEPHQEDLFEARIIQPSNKPYFRIVGQVFDTYWIIEYQDKMIMIDQHAAHEKILYEQFVKLYRNRQVVSQYVNPPIIITLNGRQEQTLLTCMEAFASLGFEIAHFEGNDYALRAIPSGFMQLEQREVFLSLLDELSEYTDTENVSLIHDRLAQMSCKAAVKGNMKLSFREADELVTKLLSLDNPYHCPHGRPTMIEFDKNALEKKFKRIV